MQCSWASLREFARGSSSVSARRAAVAVLVGVAAAWCVADAEPVRVRNIPALGGEKPFQWFGDFHPEDLAAPGNGNGHAEPGERVALGFQLLNLGKTEERGVQAKLAARDASLRLEWIRAEAAYPALPPAQEGASAVVPTPPPIEFRIPADFPAPGRIPLVVTITAGDRTLVTQDFDLPVHRPPAVALSARFEAGKDAGAPGRVEATARLAEGAPLARARLSLDQDRPAVLYSPWETSVGVLDPGKDASASFAIRPAPGMRAGAVPVRVVLRASADGVPYRWTHAVPCTLAAASPALRHSGKVSANAASVLIEEDGVPLTLPPAEPGKGEIVETPVNFPEGTVPLEIRHADPRTAGLPVTILLDGAKLGRGSTMEFAAGSTLSFDLDSMPEVACGAWVRIRSDRVIFEVMPAPVGMIHVPAGDVRLGSDRGLPEYGPARTVTLKAFAIDAFEVTNAQYAWFLRFGVGDHGCCHPEESKDKDHTPLGWSSDLANARPNSPVVGVDWFDAVAYAAWAKKRLPTEAEWECAARGGAEETAPMPPKYPWGADDEFWNRCNTGRIYPGPLPVGTFAAGRTPSGIHDLAGNASEWCSDWYGADAHRSGKAVDPTGPMTGNLRVLRGGSWDGFVLEAYTFARRSADPRLRRSDIGFRCACDP